MKKFVYLLMMVACIGLVSCSSSDEESGPLVGTWSRTESWNTSYNNSTGYMEVSYVFKSDNTGFYRYVIHDSKDGDEGDTKEFKWKITAWEPKSQVGVVEIIWNSDGRVFTPMFSLQGNTLVIGNEVKESYTKK